MQIDLDAKTNDLINVGVSLASQKTPTNEAHSFMSNNIDRGSGRVIKEALEEQTLERFDKILAFLSRTDRYSTSEVDAFVALAELSHAFFTIHEAAGTKDDPAIPYGIPVLNPLKTLGMGLWYWSRGRHLPDHDASDESTRYYALLDLRPSLGPASPYALKYSDKWVQDPTKGVWVEPPTDVDTKAELLLTLTPPVLAPRPWATRINAVVAPETVAMNRPSGRSSRRVYCPDGVTETIDVTWANVAPFDTVRVQQIPIAHPRDIPNILSELRRYAVIETLWSSLVKGGPSSADLLGPVDEISFADVIADYDKLDKNEKPTDARLVFGSTGEKGVQLDFARFNVQVTIFVGPNGSISVRADTPDLESKLQKAIERTEDLGVVSEFLKRL